MNKTIAFFFVIAMVVLQSCNKDLSKENGFSPTNPNPIDSSSTPPNNGSFIATINTGAWNANGLKYATIQSGLITIYGASTSGISMQLQVADSGVHNYSFPYNSLTNIGTFIDSSYSFLPFTTNQFTTPGNYGNLDITSIDSTISGTFSMQVITTSSIGSNITLGEFSGVKIQ